MVFNGETDSYLIPNKRVAVMEHAHRTSGKKTMKMKSRRGIETGVHEIKLGE